MESLYNLIAETYSDECDERYVEGNHLIRTSVRSLNSPTDGEIIVQLQDNGDFLVQMRRYCGDEGYKNFDVLWGNTQGYLYEEHGTKHVWVTSDIA